MPREPRIYIEKVLYLITAKGHADHALFNDREDFMSYLKPLAEYKREYGFKLFAYAILSKRLCLLIELKNNVTISTIMHNLNSKYTKSYNSRYGRKGHLFQARFKSILVEKEDYLARLTRYIHLLPKDSDSIEDFSSYPYSSYAAYVSGNSIHSDYEMPEMTDEIMEVLNDLSENGTESDKRLAYETYVRSANDEEMAIIQKRLHRTAFVGSKAFTKHMRDQINAHIREDEKSRIVRKINPGFALAGSLIVLFLGAVTYNFYNSQSALQETLNVTTSGFGAARDELANRVYSLESELTNFDRTDELDGTAWVIHMTPLNRSDADGVTTGKVFFKNGMVVVQKITGKGFPAFSYTLSTESNGRTIWKTAQARTNGTQVQMEGLWTGKKVKGLVRERQIRGESKDFTFVSVRKVTDIRRARNVVQ